MYIINCINLDRKNSKSNYDISASDNKSIAELFAQYFQSVYVKDSTNYAKKKNELNNHNNNLFVKLRKLSKQMWSPQEIKKLKFK